MFTEILFVAVIVSVLYSLINSTEKRLARRSQYAEKDVRILDHRSRL